MRYKKTKYSLMRTDFIRKGIKKVKKGTTLEQSSTLKQKL
ncbi:hypothetical protein HMPREF1154_1251 [Capnocytophaga sp. CM59]|nr:hypothetical protein HMPREF1154_1251 [Capnocytophaga sp. CM59]